MAEFILTPLAEADLDEIWDYSAEKWGDVQANRYLTALRTTIRRVASRPSLGRSCDDVRPGYFKIGAGSHMVFYSKAEGAIIVIRVLHQSMDFDRHL